VYDWGKWVVSDGARWRIDDNGEIERRANETIEAMYDEARNIGDENKRSDLRKHAWRSQSSARISAMIELAKSEQEVVASPDTFDNDAMLLGVQNGVIDLRTNSFRPSQREDYVTLCAGVAYDPKATCPNFEKCLAEITNGDEELVAYLWRVIGLFLSGLVCEEVLFVFWGTGRNGKSTFRETIHAMLGDYAISADAGLLMHRHAAGAASPDVARLKGRRLVAINESAQNAQLNEERVKFITSNDKISARKLYCEPFDFDPTHKTILTTNHKPVVRGTDEGIWRRIHLVPFTVVIPEDAVEKDFRERRLIPELPGILNCALNGLAAYREVGLCPPGTVQAATADYRDDMDVIGQWIEERCLLEVGAKVPTSVLHADYQRWATEEVGWFMSTARFGRELSDRGFVVRKGTGGRRLARLAAASLGLQRRSGR
jgi:putative DNA primase/helicase